MARHSAPRRRPTAPARTSQGRQHRASGIGLVTRYGSTGALAVTVVSCGALITPEHPPLSEQGVAQAAVQLDAVEAPLDAGGPALLSAVEPVAPEPTVFDAGALVKAVDLVEQQRAQAEAEAAEAEAAAQEAAALEEERRASTCDEGDSGFETVQSQVTEAGIELRCRFGVETVYGVAGRAGTSDHPAGLALDLMVDRDPGEDLAEYAVANMDRLGIKYVIYRQRINTGSGWEAMEDRGGATANHMDHVHVSFEG